MPDENDREDPAEYGYKLPNGRIAEIDMPHKNHGVLRWLVNGVTVGGVITAIFFSGKASTSMDTALKNDDKQDIRIERLFVQNNKLLLALTEQNIQQKASDKRFEEKFDDANKKLDDSNEKLDDINNGVQQNRENIIILQNGKLSMIDNTGVNVAMR